MNLLRKFVAALPAAVLLATLACAVAVVFSVHAQQQIPMPAVAPSAPVAATSTLIVLDPAHGGADTGAVLGDKITEKDVTLALAGRLRAALLAAGFTVASTRDSDPADPLTTDQRAEIANRSHPLACLVLHATAAGSGVHIYTSALKPPTLDDAATDTPSTFAPIPWDTAQAGFVAQSLGLAAAVTAGLGKDHIPAFNALAPLRPLDNLMCPAIAVEMAPLATADAAATPVTDAAYQQQVAAILTEALRAWRDQAHAAAAVPNLDSQIAAQSKAIAAAEAAGRAAAKAHTTSTSAPTQKGTQ